MNHLSTSAEIVISVVIPARNSEKTLDASLSALANQSIDRNKYEIIVIDDGSSDGTFEIASKGADLVVRLEGKGAAAARNTGVNHSKGAVILFTDADCEPCSKWVECMSHPILSGVADGCKGTYLSNQGEPIARFVQFEYEDKYRRMAKDENIDFIDTYSASFKREVLETLGGYDESFPGASVEDQEFSFRASSAGYRFIFVPLGKVWHYHCDSIWCYTRKKFKIAYYKVRVLKDHPQKIFRDSHTPQTLKIQMLLVVLFIITGLGSLVFPGFSFLPVLCFGLFLVSSIPMVVRILPKDPVVAFFAPIFLLFRSLALSAGLLVGVFIGRLR